MRIAICGKMGSGKTYIADRLSKEYNLKKISFAGKIKDIALDLFDTKNKDRKLLQTIADKMKEIDKDIWIKYVIREIKDKNDIIIDDLRFQNELYYLKEYNFIIIGLIIDDNTQLERLKDKYGSDYINHIDRRNHNSEKEIDNLECDLKIISNEKTFENIKKYLT